MRRRTEIADKILHHAQVMRALPWTTKTTPSNVRDFLRARENAEVALKASLRDTWIAKAPCPLTAHRAEIAATWWFGEGLNHATS